MHHLLAIAQTGLAAVLQYPLRSVATIGCVVAILLPYVVGIGLSKGLEQQAEEAVRFGADLYVTGERFGKEVPIPVSVTRQLDTIDGRPELGASMAGLGAAVRGSGPWAVSAAVLASTRPIDGVTAVVPRIVARVVLGKNREEAVLVGLPLRHFPADVSCVEGRLPRESHLNELVVGTELARRLALHVGSLIPPFYHNAQGDHLSQVVGIFKSDVALWQANLILTSFDTASAICNQEGLATDILVYCRPGYESSVRAAIQRTRPLPSQASDPHINLVVTSREDVEVLLPKGLLHREGIFNLHFLVAFAVGILTILVTSGLGTSERRREIGILKATGWQTDEVLWRSLVESFLLSLAGSALSILLAFGWLRWFNGYWIASIFLPGVDVKPGFPVPFRLTPVPALLALLISSVLVMSGTLYSSWRAAVVPPREAMR